MPLVSADVTRTACNTISSQPKPSHGQPGPILHQVGLGPTFRHQARLRLCISTGYNSGLPRAHRYLGLFSLRAKIGPAFSTRRSAQAWALFFSDNLCSARPKAWRALNNRVVLLQKLQLDLSSTHPKRPYQKIISFVLNPRVVQLGR
jgi:hypothetical protein